MTIYSKHDRKFMVSLLIGHGADIDKEANCESTPLYIAARVCIEFFIFISIFVTVFAYHFCF